MDNVFLISQECSKIEVIGKGNVVVRCCWQQRFFICLIQFNVWRITCTKINE